MGSLAKLNVAVVLVVALSLAITAGASLEDRGEYLFREGVRLAGEDDYEGALAFFERTMAYTPTVNVLWNIACCHVVLGNRDLAVSCLDRYMEHDVAFQQSAEMQIVVAAIAAEPADMPDVGRRGQLWDRVAAASQAVEKGEALVATASQRVYGTGNRGVRMKTGDDRSSPERYRASQLTDQGVEVIRSGRTDEALPLFERALAYIANQLTYLNIAVAHLLLGNRDLTLDYLELLKQRLPRLRESADFLLLMGDIGAAPPEIDAATADSLSTRLHREYDSAISSAPRPPVRTEVGDQD